MVALKVVAVPTDVMSETNLVYVSPADHVKTEYLLFKDYPFTLRVDAAVPPGCIAFNGVQRKALGITTTANDKIEVPDSPWKPPRAIIGMMKVEIEYIAASKKGGSLDCKAFTEFFLNQFHGQYFAKGQGLAAMFDAASRFSVRIIELELAGDDKATFGQLDKDTRLFVAPTQKSEISLTNVSDDQMDQQQQGIINPFELESLGIGGLRAEFGQVFRRAFASRIFPRSLVKKLGIKHVKGVLLHGPPGTGKTLIARKIGEILKCKEPKIVNGPEVFNKFVGGTEENIRKLFADAEVEQKAKGENSQLHLIIFDEFDAICKQRGAVRDGTGVSDNAVNQLLSKIDGVDSLNNVLLIGMTNRKDLIDEAILRPGRFEVHVEIGLPDEHGRVEIFRIHTRSMRENDLAGEDVDLAQLASQTKNYSGAEIEGVVKAATAYAFNRHIDFDHPTETLNAAALKVTMADFELALKDVPPLFGQAKNECEAVMRNGIIDYGNTWKILVAKCQQFIDSLKRSTKIHSMSVLLEGVSGCGKTAVAAHMAMLSQFPYVKFITSETLVGYGEMQKINIIRKVFDDSYKSSFSVIILDDIERLIEYSQLGARYSNLLLQSLLVLIKRPPPEGKKLLVVGTTSTIETMELLELSACFSITMTIPPVTPSALGPILRSLNISFQNPADEVIVMQRMPKSAPIKRLMLVIEMASDVDENGHFLTVEAFMDALQSAGLLE